MSVSHPSKNTDSLFVAPLTYFEGKDLALAGGKGANLGELIKAGFNVPPGFVITTVAYDSLLQFNNLQEQIQKKLATLQMGNPDAFKEASWYIRDLISRVSIPDTMVCAFKKAYRQLGSGAVAVRSSATAEDLPGAAFAGQQETILNVIGEQALLDAVRDCWTSLWSDRAVLYRTYQHIDQTSVKLAIVVQRMVQAEVAGVMFTANPVSGAQDELVIDANPGLGEAVVSGFVTPDHSVVKKHNLRIKEERPGRREAIIRSKAQGGTAQIMPKNQEDITTLSRAALRELARLGRLIEKHYGAPQDIEWAWVEDGSKAGKFCILQARPMTALPKPVKVNGPMRMVIPMLVEMWPARPYPLDMTTFTGEIERAIGNLLVVMIGKSAPDPAKALVEEDGVVVRFEPPKVHPSPAMLITPWLTLWHTRHCDPAQWQADAVIPEVLTNVRELEQRDLNSLSWDQNLETLHTALALIPRVMELRERYLPQTLLSAGILWVLLAICGNKDRFGKLISGVETKTTETNRALDALAAQIRHDAVLREIFTRNDSSDLPSTLQRSQAGQNFLESFSGFLTQYGHRETALTISQPAWKDRPEVVLGILKVLAGSDPQEAGSYQVWKRERDELLENTPLGRWPLHNLFWKSLANTRALFQIREDTHFYATLVQPLVRRVVLELGHRLEQIGAVDKATDVFHLKLAELESSGRPWPLSSETIARVRALIARRRARRESLANQPMFDPRLLTTVSQTSADENVILRGSAGSPGIASGPARIVRDVSEFGKLQPGDVLVAPVTNPAWTPLFQRAVAVVVDTGGVASHAAIVAREYGVPAVMGTIDGTRKLSDGQWIQVDGSRGLVLNAKQ